jgi:hypothetical protein
MRDVPGSAEKRAVPGPEASYAFGLAFYATAAITPPAAMVLTGGWRALDGEGGLVVPVSIAMAIPLAALCFFGFRVTLALRSPASTCSSLTRIVCWAALLGSSIALALLGCAITLGLDEDFVWPALAITDVALGPLAALALLRILRGASPPRVHERDPGECNAALD